MKHSTILFSLLFTLATSVHIEINREPGIYIWNISENWNKDPKYEKFDRQQWDTSTPADIPVLDTCNTYIILEINTSYEFYLFYWVGAQSSKEKRINVAHSVGFIFTNEIRRKTRGVNLKEFRRVIEGSESGKFWNLFRSPKNLPKLNKLYRITGSRGQFIMEVPLMYDELNTSDTFVLERLNEVLIWNSSLANEHKKHQAEILTKRILKIDKKKKYDRTNVLCVTSGDPTIHWKEYVSFKKKFLQDLVGVRKLRFPSWRVNYSDIELENKIREKFVLYEYGWFLNHVMKQKVKWEILTMETFVKFNTYVLVDFHNGNIFSILGSHARTEQIKIALSDAEQFSMTNGEFSSRKRVGIICKKQKVPTNFIIYLQDGLLQP